MAPAQPSREAPRKCRFMYGVRANAACRNSRLNGSPVTKIRRPVRIGNAASTQFQLDVYGEVMGSIYQAHQAGIEIEETDWRLQVALMKFLESTWQEPDEGIWEVRGGRKHFTHSKMMAWVAFRSRGAVGRENADARRTNISSAGKKFAIRSTQEVCERGYNSKKKAFTQFYGSDAMDASLLMMPTDRLSPDRGRTRAEHRRGNRTRSDR